MVIPLVEVDDCISVTKYREILMMKIVRRAFFAFEMRYDFFNKFPRHSRALA